MRHLVDMGLMRYRFVVQRRGSLQLYLQGERVSLSHFIEPSLERWQWFSHPPIADLSKPGTLRITAEGASLSAGNRPVGPKARSRATSSSATAPAPGTRARSTSAEPAAKRAKRATCAKHATEAVSSTGAVQVYNT